MSARLTYLIAIAWLFVPLAQAHAQRVRPVVAVLPAGYFSADESSADRITEGFRAVYENQGYQVVAQERVAAATATPGFDRRTHHPDRDAVRIGRQLGVDLVVYPRLLVFGYSNSRERGGPAPEVVILVRVLNVHTGNAIYARQIGHEFSVDPTVQSFSLPEPVAIAGAQEAAGMYFESVAGSRQEGHEPLFAIRRCRYRADSGGRCKNLTRHPTGICPTHRR